MAILGIDEVGRGPLAGPLVIGAVILPEFELGKDGELLSGPEWILELKDSKKLSKKKRERLSAVILKEAVATGLGFVPAAEIDEVGMSEALRLACRRAVKSVQRLHAPFTQIMIDGKVNFLKDTALADFVSTMPKADDLVKEVSAASIIAKVARDNYMQEVAEKFPGYGFSEHVGYGTAKHLAALRELGPCIEHRRSFEPIKSMVGFVRPGPNAVQSEPSGARLGPNVARPLSGVVKNTTQIGRAGEAAVCDFLVAKGHKIVAKNFRTEVCEIDIVSICAGRIYFVEVKTRASESRGGGMAAVDRKKLERMEFSVEVFLKNRPEYRKYEPLMAVASVTRIGAAGADVMSAASAAGADAMSAAGQYRVRDLVIIR